MSLASIAIMLFPIVFYMIFVNPENTYIIVAGLQSMVSGNATQSANKHTETNKLTAPQNTISNQWMHFKKINREYKKDFVSKKCDECLHSTNVASYYSQVSQVCK